MTGQEFRERRRRMKITQEQIGLALDVSRRSIIAWENDDVPITRLADLALRCVEDHPELIAKAGRRAGIGAASSPIL